MTEYPYTTVHGKLKKLLLKMREVGVPPKATGQWLKSVGFTSSNDSSMLTVLKYIGMLDVSGVPTEVWRNYRGAHHGRVLANAIREGYGELFSVYPDANSRSSTEIEHVVSTSSSAGKQAIGKTVRTFQVLCEAADFSATGVQPPIAKPNATETPNTPTAQEPVVGKSEYSGDVPSLHIDIQVHISPDSTPEQIDKIFESMAKHLYAKK